jgi:hypothetical protein
MQGGGPRAAGSRCEGTRAPARSCRVVPAWLSKLTLLVAIAFGVLAPVRVAPQEAESEEVAEGDRSESESTAHARSPVRPGRRGERLDGPARQGIALAHVFVDGADASIAIPRPRWLRPRRVSVPDDGDPLG